MKGQYKTKDGKAVNVSHFDEENKIAYADLGEGESRWCPESEYSTWIKEGETELTVDQDEEPVKKKTTKKKNK